jgi:cyclic-di-GMP phosphodiesterase TipF (flagellum assembly factor)
MTQALLAAIYLMASATIAIGLRVLDVADVAVAALLGAVVFLSLTQIHAAFGRRTDKRRTRRELSQIRRHAQELSRALGETQAKIEEVSTSLEEKTQAQSKQIVSELKVLESLMRDFATRIAQKAKAAPAAPAEIAEHRAESSIRSAVPIAPAFGHADLLETIRASLEENRVDLYLQPIVSLPQRKLRFYEALSRLRSEDGEVIMPSQYIKVAAPAGLMSVVDNLLLFRCVQIMRRLIQKNRDIGLFCNISGDTLADTEFFPQFLEYMHHNRDLAPQIIFEFSQAAALAAGPKGEENLTYLSGLGFALSMDHVETLALDFAQLASLGFRHIKIRAGMLTNGLKDAHANVAAEDLKLLLERHGLNLIAERVEEERTVVQLLDYNVDFAQGYLFGEPRAVKDDQKTLPDTSAPIIPFRRAVNH